MFARCSIGSGPKTEVDLADRVHQAAQPLGFAALVRHEQALALPENAAPTRSSSRLELRTTSGTCRALERERQPCAARAGTSSAGRPARCAGTCRRICSISRYLWLWTSSSWLCSMKLRMPSEVIPTCENADRPTRYAPVRSDDRVGEQQAGALASELAVAAGRGDRAMQHAEVIADADERLRLVDELRVVGQQPAGERHAQAGLDGVRQFEIGAATLS